jgi:HEXXH motif-containing protein
MTQDEEEDAEIPLDPWSSIFGYDGQATWAVSEEAPEHVEAEVRKAALVAMRAYAIAAKHLPHIWLWVREFTRVVMPLDGVGRTFRSSSYPEYPGLVLADATSELQLLEALVHESAHHLLYSWEGHGDLIDPDDRTTYSSPLRPDPRPLRGILLAYHALSYIYAFYGDFAASVPGRAVDVAEIDELRVKRDEARETIEGSLTAITPLGRAFLNETANVAAYAA